MSEELKQRTKLFALRSVRLCEALPESRTGRVVANQLLRSATSVAANYRAACRARSRREFIAKLGLVEEEIDESDFWIDLIIESGLQPVAKVSELKQECEQLVRIMAKSRLTARLNARK